MGQALCGQVPLQGVLDGEDDLRGFRIGHAPVAGDYLAVSTDEELVEVPADFPGKSGVFAGEVSVERVLPVAVHFDLLVHREGDPVVQGAERRDVGVRARFLAAELVARKSEDDESFVFVSLIQGFEVFVLPGEPALGGDIDYEQHFAFVFRERFGLVVDGGDGNVVDHFGGKLG